MDKKIRSKAQKEERGFQTVSLVIVIFVLTIGMLGWLLYPGIKTGEYGVKVERKEIRCPMEGTLPYVVAEVRSAVVKIEIEGIGSGSGVFIRDNLIITAGHILDMAEEYRYYSWLDGTSLLIDEYDEETDEPTKFIITCDNEVKLVMTKYYREPNLDIGFLEVDLTDPNYFHDSNSIKSLRILRLEFSDVVVGESVFAIGSPLGNLFNSVSSGIVSALDRKELSYLWDSPLLQTDCPINPGNSGCPLFNMQGQIVGIAVGGYSYGDGLHLCIPSKVVQAILVKYDAVKELERVVGE